MGGEKEQKLASASNRYAPESQIDWLDGGAKERKDLLENFLESTKKKNASVLAELLSTSPGFESFEDGVKGERFVRDFWTATIKVPKPQPAIFTCDAQPSDETAKLPLEEIARKIAKSTTASGRLQPAGYTYLGQFITHDLVSSTNLINERIATPVLNLDSLYFDESIFDFTQLVKWKAITDQGFFSFSDGFDLKRETWSSVELKERGIQVPTEGLDYHIAIIPEHRNDGNIILSQLHLFWQKVHNYFAWKVQKKNTNYDGQKIYSVAKKLTTLIFQHVAVEDYLSRTIDPDVYQYYFLDDRELQLLDLKDELAIPLEFSHAVSRYGHTMVREGYILKDNNVQLGELFAKNQFAGKVLAKAENKKFSPNENLIDWSLFFNPIRTSKDNRANTISVRSTQGLHSVQGNVDEERPIKLIMADLNASKSLATYGEILRCGKLNSLLKDIKDIRSSKQYFNRISFDHFDDIAGRPTPNIDNCPFWLAQLLESEAAPSNDVNESVRKGNADKMGFVASVVMAETIKASILSAETSIYKLDEFLESHKQDASEIYRNFVTTHRRLKIQNLIPLTK